MSDFLTTMKRTHYCGHLGTNQLDSEVILMGWVHRRRDHGGVIFVDFRDREGLVQIVFNPEFSPDAHREAHKIRSEYVLAVRGTVRGRPEGMINPDMKTGAIEVMIEDEQGDGVPGLEVWLMQADVADRAVTGLKPAKGLGTVDFAASIGESYTIAVGQLAKPLVTGLELRTCPAEGDDDAPLLGAWRIVIIYRPLATD